MRTICKAPFRGLGVVLGLGVLSLLAACGGKQSASHSAESGDTLTLHHAAYLRMIDMPEGYTLAELINPWDTTQLLHTYLLIAADDSLPTHLPAGTVVRTPLQKSLVYSAVHTSLLRDLDALQGIGGVCDAKYFLLPEIQEAMQAGKVVDCGDTMNPDIERIITLQPDAILLSPFENSGGYGRIEKLNIPLIECADYMESSPLGRAEWMRFFGRLFGKAQKADSLFKAVEQRYTHLKAAVQDSTRHIPPMSVMSDLITGSTWYTPGGRSTIARLYADAGAHYIFAEDRHTGSLPYSFERIYERGRNADVWLIRYNQPTTKTYKELESEFAGYKGFKAFGERNIYACNTGIVPFYEEVPFHPDRLLEDLIRIFRPDVPTEKTQRYYERLTD